MKKVIFVCLLSLSLCMSQQNPTQDVQLTQKQENAGPVDNQPSVKVEASTGTGNTTTANVTAAANATQVQPLVTKETQTLPASIVPSNASSFITNDTKQNSAKPEENSESKAKNETVPANGAGEKVDPKPEPIKNGTDTNAPAANKTTNGTNPDDNKNKDAVTPKADEVTPKSDTVKTTEKPVVLQKRAFDGPSFIGGMILTLGLLAIGFMGFKYYKNQTERNYHTL